MLEGVMLLWFILAALALLFVAIDIRTTPESPVLKWGFVLLTAYTGVFMFSAVASPCPDCMNATPRRAGARHWDRPCIASPATASAFSPAR